MSSTISVNIDALLAKYSQELQDFSSEESIYIRYITDSKNEYENTVLIKAINVLETDEYIHDLFDYLAANRLQLSFENIEIFLDNRRNLQLNQLREDFANKDYKSFGNFLMFFYRAVLNNPEITSFKANSTDELNYKQYILTPKISYLEPETYKNYNQGREDYWKLVKEYAISQGFTYTNSNTITFTSEFNIPFTKRIISTLLNRRFDNKVNGSTLLVEADQSKSNFPVSLLDNIDIKRILTGDYKTIYREYFLENLEKMYEELLDYKLENDLEWDSSNFLEGFLTQKMTALNLEDLTIDILKEIKFYRFLLVRFLNRQNDSSFATIFTKEINFTLELDNLQLLFKGLRDYLKQKGYFE
jgi:effector-binding domain-containing protein